jgi:DNA polymerase-4
LQSEFGDAGVHLWNLAHGIDNRIVVPDRAAKSISHEITLAVDVDDEEVVRAWLLELSDQVGRRLRRNALTGRTVQLKVRFRDFRTITRSKKLVNATDLTQEIFDSARALYEERVDDCRSVRLLGVGVSGLETLAVRQKLLFDETCHEVNQQADKAADAIRKKFGQQALSRGSRLLHQTNHRALPSVTDRPAKPDGDDRHDPI